MHKKKKVIEIKEICWICKEETDDKMCCERCGFCTCYECLSADLTCKQCNTGGEG